MLNGIALECSAARVLGEAVDIVITTLDEANHRIKPNKIIGDIEASGGRGLVALVGVQTNQFPRAVDIARPLRAADVPVCIGGFHISGCLSMLPRIPPEIQQALDLGISIFAGEAEGQFDKLLRDAYRRQLKPIYNVMADHPRLQGATLPVLPQSDLEGRLSGRASFDSGRGCPYDCSFCTIINVQGRKSRYRTADDVEKVLRDHYALGIKKFFITDDNFARNKNWEAIFDRIIELRQEEGMQF
ncbi:MAG: radical SAM protein, partial [bacterium]|nr:radical SAM protein [bacterium]